jgi:hypothetical protein
MGARPRSETGFADYLELLRVFDEREAEALIIGGQAVNFWAEVFEEEEPELQKYRPFSYSVRNSRSELCAVGAAVTRRTQRFSEQIRATGAHLRIIYTSA